MNSNILRPVLLTYVMLWAMMSMAQKDLMLFGLIKDLRSGAPVANACVLVSTDSIAGDSTFSDPAGRYQVFVPLQGVHRLTYSSETHHHKIVEVDTNGEMAEEDRGREWNMRIDITLLIEDLDMPGDLLDTPIGIASWIPERKAFEWDTPYTERYMQRFKQAVKAAEKK